MCASVAEFVSERGSDLAKLAIQFSTPQPGIATTVIGNADPQELERNLQWAAETPDEELLALVRAKLEPIHNMAWTTGRIENS